MLGRVFLGRYESIRLLGEGGMGRVFLGRQLDLGRQVVIKVMHDHIAAEAKFRERFQRETLLMARFQHPYAVTLYDASLNDPQGPCIIMEFIRGVTLDTLLLRNGRLSPLRVGRLLGQICEVLQAAQVEGIVHRDLKPSNLMIVDPETPYEKIKVMDFGLAKILHPPVGVSKITESNVDFAVGTPGYICPEQVRGEESDHRGDLYSVGIILYEMLAGRLPFSGRSTMDILLAHATEQPPPFSEVGAGDWVPPAIEAVIQACLAKEAADRPQSARELAERYEAALTMGHAPLPAAIDPTGPQGRALLSGPGQTEVGPTADPRAVMFQLDAWMPEKIAVYKLRGFVQDYGGEVVESIPGLIRVRLGIRTPKPGGPLGWLGVGKSTVYDLELRLQQKDPTRNNHLHVTALITIPGRNASTDADARDRCTAVFIDLRAYLMGANPSSG
jgi:serine/threonine-protein kinase